MQATRTHAHTETYMSITALSATVAAREKVVWSGLKSCSDTFDKQMKRVKSRTKQCRRHNRHKGAFSIIVDRLFKSVNLSVGEKENVESVTIRFVS